MTIMEESANTIVNYLKYLRDVSRKIISRGGFDNVFPREIRTWQNFYFDLERVASLETLLKGEEVTVSIDAERDFFDYLFKVNNIILNPNTNKHLFAGYGIFVGKFGNKTYFAPMLTSLCNVFYESGDNQIIFDLGLDNIQFNYDFLARVSDFRIEDEELEEIHLTQEVEILFKEIDSFLLNLENNISKETIQNLGKQIIELIPALKGTETNIEYFTQKSYPTNFAYEKRFDAVNSYPFFFEPHIFLFVRDLPGALTTYQSINQLLEQDLQKNELLLTLLEDKLLNKTKPFPKPNDVNPDEVDEILLKMPIELSDAQKDAIKKAWLDPILYIQGPPGTGKSHTIQALIYSALLLNKKVLFISHKLPAINVVKNNIDNLLEDNKLIFPSRDFQDYKEETIQYFSDIVDKFSSSLDSKKQEQKLIELEIEKQKISKNVENIIRELKSLWEVFSKNCEYVRENFEHTNNVYEIVKKIQKEIDELGLNFKLNLSNYEFLPLVEKEPPPKFYNLITFIYRVLTNQNAGFIVKLIYLKTIDYLAKKFKVPKKLIARSPDKLVYLYKMNYHGNLLKNYSDKNYGIQLSYFREQILKLNKELQSLSKKLLQISHRYNILKKIISNLDSEVTKSIKNYYLSLKRISKKYIQQHWQEIDFDALLDIFPIWCASLREVSNVLPLKPHLFDMIIIDEASQVNIAEVIPVFFRGKRFCIVGDDKQLHLNSVGLDFALSKAFDAISWGKNKLHNHISFGEAKTKKLLVSEASILNFIMFEFESQTIPKVFLDEHYRSLPKLIEFNNKRFYDRKLLIMTDNLNIKSLNCYEVIKVEGRRDTNRKFVQAEIDKGIEVLQKLVVNDGWKTANELKPLLNLENLKFSMPDGRPSIGIITFLRDQVNRFIEILNGDNILSSEELLNKYDFMIGTPEEFQGNERDIMILMFGLDSESNWGKQHYENPNRFNVATSRARYFTYVIYAGIPKNAKLIREFFENLGVSIDCGTTTPEEDWIFDKKRCESDFELRVAEYLEKYVAQRPGVKLFNQVNVLGGKFRLDFVLFNEKKNISLAVEVDGKHHFKGDTSIYTQEHLNRIKILNRSGWKVINLQYFDWFYHGWLNDDTIKEFNKYIEDLYNRLDKLLEIQDSDVQI